jgi:hypothetical protein
MIGLNSAYMLNAKSVDDEKAAAGISSKGFDDGFSGFLVNVFSAYTSEFSQSTMIKSSAKLVFF